MTETPPEEDPQETNPDSPPVSEPDVTAPDDPETVVEPSSDVVDAHEDTGDR